MKIPLSWLREYVDFADTVEGLADKLTFSGVEVEGIERLGGGVPGVVVAEVLAIEKHPNADKLTLCKVNYGGPAEMTVVCGAPNVAVGGKYPFAPLGTTLPCLPICRAHSRHRRHRAQLSSASPPRAFLSAARSS